MDIVSIAALWITSTLILITSVFGICYQLERIADAMEKDEK